MNLFAYAGNNPIAFTDPFGLAPDDIYYNTKGQEVARTITGKPDRHFVLTDQGSQRLDYGLQPGDTPYEIHSSPDVFDATAKALTAGTRSYGLLGIYRESQEGKQLDFKRLLPDRALWNAGDGLYTHKDKVGNTAWAYYVSGQGVPLWVAKRGAGQQARSVGQDQDDPADQDFIERGYNLRESKQ